MRSKNLNVNDRRALNTHLATTIFRVFLLHGMVFVLFVRSFKNVFTVVDLRTIDLLPRLAMSGTQIHGDSGGLYTVSL